MQLSGNLHRLTEVGWLKAFRDERSARRARERSGFAARLIAECGIEAEHHDADSLAELEPALRPVFKAAVVLPGGGLVDDPGARSSPSTPCGSRRTGASCGART